MSETLAATTPEGHAVRAWFWVLPLGAIVTRDGAKFDLAHRVYSPRSRTCPADLAAESLSAWYAKMRPRLKMEHAPGLVYGRATGETRVMSGRDAIAKGANPSGVPDAALDVLSFFAEFDIDDAALATAYKAGRVRASSPMLTMNAHTDDDPDTLYRVINEELSITATPVQQTRQIDATALAGVALSADTDPPVGNALDTPEVASLSSDHQTDPRVTMDDPTTDAPAEPSLEDLAAALESLMSRVAVLEDGAPMAEDGEDDPEAAPMAEGDDDESEEMSALRSRLADLEAVNLTHEATARLSALDLDDDRRATLLGLASSHGLDVLDTVLTTLPAAPVRQTAALGVTNPAQPDAAEPVSLAAAATDPDAAATLSARAHKLVADGKADTLADAYTTLTAS